MTMKKIITVCLAACMLLAMGAAWAQGAEAVRPGIAVAAPQNPQGGGTIKMYASADGRGDVLMEYYSGTVMEVLRVEGGMARVQCGEEGAALTGYVHIQDIRCGELAMREVPRCYMRIQLLKPVQVQAYCDAQADTLYAMDAAYTIDTCGKNGEKWVQLMRHPIYRKGEWTQTDDERGFVYMETGRGKGLFVDEGSSWLVLPAEGELTYEQACARALDLALEHPKALEHVRADRRNREVLDTFWADARLTYDKNRGSARWDIYFQAPDDYEQAFHVSMEADGTLIDVYLSNG